MQIFSLDLYLFYLDLNIVLAPPQTWHWLALWQRGEREGAREVEIYICSALATQVGKWNQCDVAPSSSHTHTGPISGTTQSQRSSTAHGVDCDEGARGRGTIGRGGRLWGTAIAPLFSQITNLYRRNGCLAYLKNQSIRIEFVCALISFWTTFC